MVVRVKGDILNAEENIICHQVNCQGFMNKGLAKEIRKKWSNVYAEYKELVDKVKNKSLLLGTCQIVMVQSIESHKFVSNLFAQLYFGKGFQTNYNALTGALNMVKNFAKENKYSIALPCRIGCGLAGGDWGIVKSIIHNLLDEIKDVYIYDLEGNND